MIWERVVGIGQVPVGYEAALVGDGLEREGASGDRHVEVLTAVVPAQLADEQPAEIQALQMTGDMLSVEVRRHFSLQ